MVHMNTTKRKQTLTDRVTSAFAAGGHESHSVIADMIGTSQEDVSHMLSGQYDFTIEQLVTIGDALNVDYMTLLGRTVTADENYLNTAEAAEFAHRKPDTIRKHIQAGRLKSVQAVKGGRHLVRETDLKTWMGCTP